MRSGVVTAIDNRRLAKVAKLAGAPHDPLAGVDFHSPLEAGVEAGQPLYTIHAQTPGERDYALAYARPHADIIKVSEP